MTTGEPLPSEQDLLLGYDRGYTPKQEVDEPEEAPPGQAGTSRTEE